MKKILPIILAIFALLTLFSVSVKANVITGDVISYQCVDNQINTSVEFQNWYQSNCLTHYACNAEHACVEVEGEGTNSCEINSDCEEATPTPTPTPEVTPAPSNPGGPGDGRSDGLGCASHDCSSHPSTEPTKAVLGLSTTSSNSLQILPFIQLAAAFGFVSLGFGLFRKHA